VRSEMIGGRASVSAKKSCTTLQILVLVLLTCHLNPCGHSHP